MDSRIINYVKLNCETQGGTESVVPPKDLANFLKIIDQFKHHSFIALIMLLMHAQIVTLYSKEHESNAIETKQKHFTIKDSSKLGLFLVLRGECRLVFKVVKTH